MSDLATALALVLVLEGVLWALAPDGMKRAAARVSDVPSAQLRTIGLAAAGCGVLLVWILRG
ncbi:MAG: DUF2065 domain-containing protein [Geminicoccaceae bacterium]|nr:DUF2065 domain-containing protein [Geminicoccaceae bacterium]